MTILTFLLLFTGLVLLVIGAELLVRGASRLAAVLGIPPLIIGLTIVAYGTSAPEMAVSVMSSFAGQTDIAVGNVVGSNIFNILFILGISSLIVPLAVSRQLIRSDVPIMIGVAILMLIFGLDGKISRVDGIILFIGCVVYTLSLAYQSRQQKNDSEEDEFSREYGYTGTRSPVMIATNLGFIVGGLLLLVLGSRWLVDSAIAIARALEVSELLIGLTIVSAGTSLPELATSVIASIRGERDIAVGNVLGSNIFNILAVLGLAGIVSPGGLDVSQAILSFDAPVMIAASIACLPIFASGYQIVRWEGLLFTGYYIAYTVYLILDSTNHESLPFFSKVMLAFVIPITLVTICLVTWQDRRAAKQIPSGSRRNRNIS
jgi:cation:H+ antiporter